MDKRVLRIGTRESQLAVWQATLVKNMLAANGYASELVFIKSEGDIDLKTPLYEMGVQGIFTRSLDIALLNNTIDLAVHSMKDVPTRLPHGLAQAAILERASHKDLLVFKGHRSQLEDALNVDNGHTGDALIVATSSIRRKAQWLNRYPHHQLDNLRGNVNTRLQKLADSAWNGAIFAAAGLERIDLRPENSMELDWMLPAPAQGAIMIVSRTNDEAALEAAATCHHSQTALCTMAEKDFLRRLMGGCSTPISALAQVNGNTLLLKGNIFSLDGKQRADVHLEVPVNEAENAGGVAAEQLLQTGGQAIFDQIHHGAK